MVVGRLMHRFGTAAPECPPLPQPLQLLHTADVSDDVTYAVTGSCSPLVSDLEVAGGPGGHAQMLTACRANPFLTVLPVNGDVISANRAS